MLAAGSLAGSLAGWLAAAGTLVAWRGAHGACGMAHGGDKGHAAAAADEALDADAAGLLLLEGVKIDNFEGWQNAAGRCRGAKGGPRYFAVVERLVQATRAGKSSCE